MIFVSAWFDVLCFFDNKFIILYFQLILFKGFYWDVTDWAGQTKDLDTTPVHVARTAGVGASVNSSSEFINGLFRREGAESCCREQFSPIYSKNFKAVKHVNFVEATGCELDESETLMEDEETHKKCDFDSASRNYMYLLNAEEFDRTTESQEN